MAYLSKCKFCGEQVLDRNVCGRCAEVAASLVLEGKRPTMQQVQNKVKDIENFNEVKTSIIRLSSFYNKRGIPNE